MPESNFVNIPTRGKQYSREKRFSDYLMSVKNHKENRRCLKAIDQEEPIAILIGIHYEIN